jgi:hypothetical protein
MSGGETSILGFTANGGIEYMMMDAHRLEADNAERGGYQRKPISSHVEEIATAWDLRFYNPPLVSIRADGGRFIMDGNHTTKAAILRADRNGGANAPVFILVRPYYNLTRTQEASFFVKFNSNNTPVNTNGQFKSRLAAGEIRTVHIYEAVRAAGLYVNLDSCAMGVDTIGAIIPLYDVYDRGDFDHLRVTLETIDRAFGSDPKKFGKNQIIGMSLFLMDNPTLDREAFINHIYTADITVASIKATASGLKKNCGANSNLWDETARVFQAIADNPTLTKYQLSNLKFLAPPARKATSPKKPNQQKLKF